MARLSAYLILLSCISFAQTATEYNRYLARIFEKYGSGGTMSFEGLEHLMYNLGLGQLEFDPTHTIEEHRPNGLKNDHIPSEQEMKMYFEQQTKKFLPTPSAVNEDTAENSEIGSDVMTKTENDKEKGVRLEFKEMHDPKHRHPRENDPTFDGPPLTANVCLSPKSLLRLVIDHDDLHKRKLYKTVTTSLNDGHDFEEEYNDFINNVILTPVAFMKLCPALLSQIDQHVCVRPAPIIQEVDAKEQLWNAWIYATGCIFLLSACGLCGILIVPLMKTVAYQEMLKFLVAVAVGTLGGDALMHLLPHALFQEHGEPEEHSVNVAKTENHGHDTTPILICGCAFASALFMYILETLLPLLKGENAAAHGHGHSHGGHAHDHSQQKSENGNSQSMGNAITMPGGEINTMLNELKIDKKAPSAPLTPVAFMVVIGDGLHNLTDGLAIGAAFASNPVTGLATAFAVLCHELPHELGDFALLLQTGVSLKRAVCLNIVSSVLSFIGMAVGLLVAGVHANMTQWIYACTAGSFLYIAFADLIPAMNMEGKQNLKNTLIQILGIAVGGVIMLAIALNEDDLESLFK